MLNPNGIIRIVVPDFAYFSGLYNKGEIKEDDFLNRLGIFHKKQKSSLKNVFALLHPFSHQCMYDSSSLIEAMEEVGFKAAAKRGFDSAIPDIKKIEKEGRVARAAVAEGRKIVWA